MPHIERCYPTYPRGKLDGRVLVDDMDILEHDVAELSTKVGIVFES